MDSDMKNKVPQFMAALMVFVASFLAISVDAIAQENLVVNGNFSSGELAPWSTFLADWEGTQANFTVADNKVTIENIVTNGGQSWFIQLNQILTAEQIGKLKEGSWYRLRFDVNAAEERPLTVYFGENGGGFTALSLSNLTLPQGESSHSIGFQVTGTWADMKLGFELGRSAVTTSITNVTLVEYDPNIIVNGNFSSGELAPWSTFLADWEGTQANFTVADNKVTVENIVTNGGQSWFVQLNQVLTAEQIAALSVGKAYKLTFDVVAVEERPLTVFFGEDGGGFTALSASNLTLPAGASSQEITVNVTQTWGNMKLGFELGRSAVTTSITNVSFIEAGDIKVDDDGDDDRKPGMIVGPNIVVNGDFGTGELAPWTTFLADWEGTQANFNIAGNKMTIENIVTNGNETWFVQLIQVLSPAQLFQLNEGTIYRLAFDVEVAEDRPLTLYFGEDGGGWTALVLKTFDLTAGTHNLEIIFELTGKWDNMKLGFELGKSAVTTTLSNISLHEYVYVEPSENIVINGDFATGNLDFWTTFVADFAGAAATYTVADGKATISDIAVTGSDAWHIQLYQGLSAAQIGMLEIGREYEIIFTTDAASARPLVVYFGEDGGSFRALSATNLALPEGVREHKITVEVTETFGAMKLGFELGFSNVTTTFSNIKLQAAPGAPPGKDPAPVMEEDFILFAAGGRHISIPSISQGNIVEDASINFLPFLEFNYGNWTIGGFDWGNTGVNVANRRAAQDSIFMRIWSSPNNRTDARETNGNNTAKIIFLDIGETGNLEFRTQMALPDEVHVGQWIDVAFPLPTFTTKTELDEAKASGALTGHAALWEYWGTYSPVREMVIDDVEDEDWREFNWERVRRIGIYWDQFRIPGAPIYIEHMYIGRRGVDLTVATQGPAAMGGVTGTNLGETNVLSWSPRDDIFSYGIYYSGKPFSSLDEPGVRLWGVVPGSVTQVEHPVFQPHPAISEMPYYYAVAPGNAWGVLSQDVSNSSVAIQAKGEPKGFIFQLTADEEIGVFNALDRGEFPGPSSFPKGDFEPVRLRYPGEANDFWTGPQDSQADVWMAYGTADGYRTLFFYGEVLDDDVLGGPVGNEAGMSGTTIYPRCCLGDFEATTWVPGIDDTQLEWNFYLKDQLVIEFGGYITNDYVTGSTNHFRSRGATPEYLLSFQPYFSSTATGNIDINSNPSDMLVRLWITEQLGASYVPSPGEIPRDYRSLYYNSKHPLTTPAVYENMLDESGKRIGWRFFAAVDSQDLLVATEGGTPVDSEITLPGVDELAYLPITMQLWDKDGGVAPGNWWETATSIIQFPTKPWGFSAAVNSSNINGMGALAIAGRNVVTSIDEGLAEAPRQLELYQNYPNPFNPTTTIEFQLPEASFVTLSIYNSIGQRVAVLSNSEMMMPGRHSVQFNGRNLSSGVYFYRLDTGSRMLQRKMILIK
jgi:hypothetical protein